MNNAANFPLDKITVSVMEAARSLGLGKTSIYALISAEKLATVKFGSRTLITTESIRKLVNDALVSSKT